MDPLRHHRKHQHLHGNVDLNTRFGPEAEKFARFFGTVKYLLVQTIIVVIWIAINAAGVIFKWDPYPFILLNLVFSTQAAYAAPLILLAQNRQADRDKATEQAAAEHLEEQTGLILDRLDVNTEGGIKTVLERLDQLDARS